MELLSKEQMAKSCEALALGSTRVILTDRWMEDPSVQQRIELEGLDEKAARHSIQRQLYKADANGKLNKELEAVWDEAAEIRKEELRQRHTELVLEADELCETLKEELREDHTLYREQGLAFFAASNPADAKVGSVTDAIKTLDASEQKLWAHLKLNAAQQQAIKEAL